MSEDAINSVRNFEETEKGTQNNYQRVSTGSWIKTDFDATGTRVASGLSQQCEEITPSSTLEIMEQSIRGVNNGSVRSGKSLSGLQNHKETRGSRSSQSLPTLQQRKDMRQSLSTLQGRKDMRRVQQLTPSAHTVSRIHQGKQHTTSCCNPSTAKSQESLEQIKAHAFFNENRYVESRHLQDVSGSSSGIILYKSGSGKKKFDFERSSISSYMGGHFVPANNQLHSSDIKQSETEPYRCNIHSSNFLGTTLIQSHSTLVKSSNPYGQLDPSTSDNRSLVSKDNHLQLQNFPAFKGQKFSSTGDSSELTKLKKFHHGYPFIRKWSPLETKVETLTICASLDPGWVPRHSQSTHVKFGKENGIKNVRVASDIDVNAYFTNTSTFLRQKGVKIQSLGSSTDSEGKKTHYDSEGNLMDASSAETDAMDMDTFTDKCHTSGGVNQSSPMKALNTSTMQFPRDRSGTEIGNSHISKELPDINLELVAANNAIEGAVPSSSKTQSLDMDMLVAIPCQTNNSVSGPSLDILLKTDPTERWAKRLKSFASDAQGVGTRSFGLEDVTRKKVKRLSDMLTSELGGINHMETLAVADKTKATQRNNVASSKDAAKRSKDLLLSQSWIQRWLRNQANTPEKQSQALVQCEPQSSKLVLDDPAKKQFPSIAAMALMGKAINGFQPCELQNRGTFVVWK